MQDEKNEDIILDVLWRHGKFRRKIKIGSSSFLSEIFVVIVETASLKIWNANYFL